MEHISFFIFIFLLHYSSNNQLYRRNLPITRKNLKQNGHGGSVLNTEINKELMEFTQPPFIIPYAIIPVANNDEDKDIPYSNPDSYTQSKKTNFHIKTKPSTADETTNERKREEDRKRVEKRLSEQSKVDKKLQMLERELELKRELGSIGLEPLKPFVIPNRETKVKLSTIDTIPKTELKMEDEDLNLKDKLLRRQSDKFDSSSEEANGNGDGDDKIELNYDLDDDHDLKVEWK